MTGGRVSKKREKREGKEEESRNTILVFSDFVTVEDSAIFFFSLLFFLYKECDAKEELE